MTDDFSFVAPRMRDEDLIAARHRGTTQVYRIEIGAPAERIWQAITDPEWTVRYGYGGRVRIEPRVGGRYRVEKPSGLMVVSGSDADVTVSAPEIILDGVVTAYSPPTSLAVILRFLVTEETASEPATEVRYDIVRLDDTRSLLTVTHELEGAPRLAAVVSGELGHRGAGGGHPLMLRELKALLEGSRTPRESNEQGDGDDF